MRKDTALLTRLAQQRIEENYLRCCSLNDGSKACGMVLQEQCERCLQRVSVTQRVMS